MAKPCSGSTAPSFGTRSRTWPYEARTVKSGPRYLLIVLALAGDSTMRRFLAMGAGWVRRRREFPTRRRRRPGPSGHGREWIPFLVVSRGRRPCQAGPPSIPPNGDPRRSPDPASVDRFGLVQEHLGLHPGIGRLGPGLVEQDHQDHPFEVVEVQFVLVQRDRTVED